MRCCSTHRRRGTICCRSISPTLPTPWQPFTAQLIQRSKAGVVPVFFGGQNSRLFQVASHVNLALRLSLIFKEVRDRIGTSLPVVIGDPIGRDDIVAFTDRKAMMQALMERTYQLGATLGAGTPSRGRLMLPPRAPA